MKGIDKSNDHVVVAKVLEWRPDTEAQVTREFDTLKTLRHERIAALTHAYRYTDIFVVDFNCSGI